MEKQSRVKIEDLSLDDIVIDSPTISSCLDDIESRLSKIDLDSLSKNKFFFVDTLKKIILLFGGNIEKIYDNYATSFQITASKPTELSIVGDVFKLHFSYDSAFDVKLLSNDEVTEYKIDQNVFLNSDILPTIPINSSGKFILKVYGIINKNAILHDNNCSVDVVVDDNELDSSLKNYCLIDVKEIDQNIVDYGVVDLSGTSNLSYLLGEYREETIKQMRLPADVIAIADYQFSQMKDCETIIFSNQNNISAIGSYAFCNNSKTKCLVFPDNLEWIGSNAFYNCPNLQLVVFPSSLTAIYDNAFRESLNAKAICLSPDLSNCQTISAVISSLNEKYPIERIEYTDEDYERYTEISKNENYDEIEKLVRNYEY